jgi:hypothetical protein
MYRTLQHNSLAVHHMAWRHVNHQPVMGLAAKDHPLTHKLQLRQQHHGQHGCSADSCAAAPVPRGQDQWQDQSARRSTPARHMHCHQCYTHMQPKKAACMPPYEGQLVQFYMPEPDTSEQHNTDRWYQLPSAVTHRRPAACKHPGHAGTQRSNVTHGEHPHSSAGPLTAAPHQGAAVPACCS